MDVDDARRVRRASELNTGDVVEAWHNGKLFHRGAVTRTVKDVDLFWILDSRSGTRRLIDAEALVILRVLASGPAAALAPAASPAASRTTASSPHMPLFQAPTLAG